VTEEDVERAIELGDVEKLKDLARRGARVSSEWSLCNAALYGDVELIRCLVNDLGADVNQADHEGITALYLAVQESHLALIRCLVVEFGADINKGNRDGIMPLHMAAMRGHCSVVRCLVMECGAGVHPATYEKGTTPLHIAAHEGHLAVMQCLVMEFGVDINQGDGDGSMPLHMAATMGHLSVVRCLVMECGADVNQAYRMGTTPLYMAAREGHLAVVRCLVEELGASVNAVNAKGATALMIAAGRQHQKIVAYLLRHGADPQATFPTVGTAADISKRFSATPKQIEYLEAKTHCSNPICSGAGLKKCTGCKQVRYCGQQCQLAHWPVHKAACKATAELKNGKKN
jgi:ankyrin repeat protein